MVRSDLKAIEFDVYYKRYIDKLSEETHLLKGFEIGQQNVINFFKAIPTEKLDYKYQPEKSSVKEILQHQIDTERIFIYRCFRIARRDETPLTGFDQNIYIEPSNADNKAIDQLLDEFKAMRGHSISLLNSLSENDLCYIGNSNGAAMSARAAAFTIIGHDIWHMEVIKEKYLLC